MWPNTAQLPSNVAKTGKLFTAFQMDCHEKDRQQLLNFSDNKGEAFCRVVDGCTLNI